MESAFRRFVVSQTDGFTVWDTVSKKSTRIEAHGVVDLQLLLSPLDGLDWNLYKKIIFDGHDFLTADTLSELVEFDYNELLRHEQSLIEDISGGNGLVDVGGLSSSDLDKFVKDIDIFDLNKIAQSNAAQWFTLIVSIYVTVLTVLLIGVLIRKLATTTSKKKKSVTKKSKKGRQYLSVRTTGRAREAENVLSVSSLTQDKALRRSSLQVMSPLNYIRVWLYETMEAIALLDSGATTTLVHEVVVKGISHSLILGNSFLSSCKHVHFDYEVNTVMLGNELVPLIERATHKGANRRNQKNEALLVVEDPPPIRPEPPERSNERYNLRQHIKKNQHPDYDYYGCCVSGSSFGPRKPTVCNLIFVMMALCIGFSDGMKNDGGIHLPDKGVDNSARIVIKNLPESVSELTLKMDVKFDGSSKPLKKVLRFVATEDVMEKPVLCEIHMFWMTVLCSLFTRQWLMLEVYLPK